MNYHKKVLQFVVACTSLLLLLSIFTHVFSIQYNCLKNISLIADLFPAPKPSKDSATLKQIVQSAVSANKEKLFSLFHEKEDLTAYYKDTLQIPLPRLWEKLYALQKGKRKKVRIAFLGDSMIEDDFISQTLRKELQTIFGGYGVGFLPLQSDVNNARTTALVRGAESMHYYTYKNKDKLAHLYLSGRSFDTPEGATNYIKDETCANGMPLEKWLLYGAQQEPKTWTIDNHKVELDGTTCFNRTLLDAKATAAIQLNYPALNDVYGISLEAPQGVVVDNFSFRGISGTELSKLNKQTLRIIDSLAGYDLIILQFGVNLFAQATDQQFDWYYLPMKKAIEHLKQAMPKAEILLLGCADRAFKYDTGYATAIGLPNIIALQQKIAFETNIAFYNTFASMGGDGTMVHWVQSQPSLAYKDYMHPNDKGAALLGEQLTRALLKKYSQYLKQIKP